MYPLPLRLRYKTVERLAAEEYEKERVRGSRTRPDLSLNLDPTEAWPSSSRSSTPSSFASQEETEAELEGETPAPSDPPSETGRTKTGSTVSKCTLGRGWRTAHRARSEVVLGLFQLTAFYNSLCFWKKRNKFQFMQKHQIISSGKPTWRFRAGSLGSDTLGHF